MRQLTRQFFISALLCFAVFSTSTYAGPVIKLCINDKCKKPQKIEITDACWSNVKEIFAPPFPTDKDEQDNIVNAIALIETDLYQTLAKQSTEKNTASDLYSDNSSRNNMRNIKSYIGVLLDTYLAKRHVMRKTISQTNWTGLKETGLLIQSLTDSRLYIIEPNSELSASPVVRDYKSNTNIFSGIKITSGTQPTNDTKSADDEDFE
jgi:hypothetical protein